MSEAFELLSGAASYAITLGREDLLITLGVEESGIKITVKDYSLDGWTRYATVPYHEIEKRTVDPLKVMMIRLKGIVLSRDDGLGEKLSQG